jgi:photosystem II stability/assembly factor-like uncharacterized protein
MNFRLLALLGISLGMFLPGVSLGNPTQVYKGTAHDAFYGLCTSGMQQIAVGDAGLILESQDAGGNWTETESFTDSALLDVSCGNDISLIVGQKGAIYRRSTENYQAVSSGTDERLLGVSDVSSDGLAFAVGGFGTVLRSTDGGLNWQSLTLDWPKLTNDFFEPHLYDVHVADTGIVTIVGEFEMVIQSADQGDSWEAKHIGEASLFGLSLHGNGVGFAVGQNGKILKTADGGQTWKQVDSPGTGILLNVWNSEAGDVLISGIRNMLHSADSGATWERIDQGDLSTGWYQGLSVIDEGNSMGASALLAGHGGSLIKLKLEKNKN